MTTARILVVAAAVVLAASPVAATSPLVAMRVELEPVAASGDDTTVAVVVQIAPEDRGRVGKAVWVSAELSRRGERVRRAEGRAKVERQGIARLEVTWPPGAYDLRVDIDAERTDDTGFWIGEVEIPRLGAPPSPQEPEPVPEPVPEPTQPELPPAAELPEPAPVPEPEPAEAPQPVPVEAEAPPPAERPQPEPVPVEAEPPQPQPEPVLAEPPAPSPEPTEAESPAPEPAPRVAHGPPCAERATAALADLTVIVTDERNRPVTDLGRGSFRLRVGGSNATLEGFGGPDEPLLVGLAVDLSTADEEMAMAVRRSLSRLAAEAEESGGGYFLVRPGVAGDIALDWRVDPGDLVADLGSLNPAEIDLGGMVSTSLAHLAGCAGRKVLIVVTDGGDTAGKASWRGAMESARTAGVPVLAVGLDHEGLDGGSKTSLRKLAAASGGKVYIERGPDVVEMAVDHYAALTGASYALRLGEPGGGQRIKVEAGGGSLQVHHSQALR